MLENYGVEYPLQDKQIQEKIIQTNLYRYGVKNFSHKNMINILPFLLNYDWMYNEYIIKQKTATKISEELGYLDANSVCNYLRFHKIDIIYTVGFSRMAIQWLTKIMSIENIHIRHMLNNSEGEYKTKGPKKYKVDGYCKETNTIYEFHGDIFHGNPEIYKPNDCPNFYRPNIPASVLYQETKEKEDYILCQGYNLVVMWERNFIL